MLVLLPGLVSCGDDDDAKLSTLNAITMDGGAFKVQSVTLTGVSIDGEGHATLNFISTDGVTTKTLGINFDYSPDVDVSGTYAYPQNNTDRYMDDWMTTYTVMTVSGSDFSIEDTHLLEGTFTLTHNSGSNYTVTMDLLMEDGTVFKGKYQGKVEAHFGDN